MKFSIVVLVALGEWRYLRGMSDEEFPKIEDLFPTVAPASLEPMKKLDIDLDRIDMNKFKSKLEQFEAQMIGNISMAEALALDARRQAVPVYSRWEFRLASLHILKVKAIDLMLQLIYMARHKVRQLENEAHFSNTDTAYRIAFLYRKLRRLWRRIMDVWTMISRKYHTGYIEKAQIMHIKCIKLYEEFIYLWWVLIAVDGKYQTRLKSTMARKGTRSRIYEATEPLHDDEKQVTSGDGDNNSTAGA